MSEKEQETPRRRWSDLSPWVRAPVGYGVALVVALALASLVAVVSLALMPGGGAEDIEPSIGLIVWGSVSFLLNVVGGLGAFFLAGIVAAAMIRGRPYVHGIVLGLVTLAGFAVMLARGDNESGWQEFVVGGLMFIIPEACAIWAGAAVWERRRKRLEAKAIPEPEGLPQEAPLQHELAEQALLVSPALDERQSEEQPKPQRSGANRVLIAYLVGLGLLPVGFEIVTLGPVFTGALPHIFSERMQAFVMLAIPGALAGFILGFAVSAVARERGVLHAWLFGVLLAAFEAPITLAPAFARGLTPNTWPIAAQPLVLLFACWTGGALAAWLAGRKQLTPAPT